MSKKIQVHEVYPPIFLKEHPYEQDTYYGLKCSQCHGNGWYPVLGERNESIREVCPVCQGSGKLKAVVTTKWMPDKKE
ncbi:hypothetical protein [Bacteroides sp.]|uniref:hypothetical protein n=1 Tax=Bacteroides sp. TaxID=29523 RepID=UPI002639B25C|nr:hypothetical protein [Bacteroides sp.]MDD3040918.1 hypothetical protein [Bacteroides sp.]